MKRTPLTAREKLAMLEDQRWLCGICGEHLGTGRVEFDHEIPLAIKEAKASHAVCLPCHIAKTKCDRKDIAKAYRRTRKLVEGLKRKTRPIHSRGFDKAWSRRLDGTVVRRFA